MFIFLNLLYRLLFTYDGRLDYIYILLPSLQLTTHAEDSHTIYPLICRFILSFKYTTLTHTHLNYKHISHLLSFITINTTNTFTSPAMSRMGNPESKRKQNMSQIIMEDKKTYKYQKKKCEKYGYLKVELS